MTTTSVPPEPFWSPVVLRLATAGDQRSLERLAQLDSQSPPVGTTLMAELRGRPVAALSLGDGQEIADPFVATGEIRALLRLRAAQLRQPAQDSGRWVRPSLRRVRPQILRSASSARCAAQPLSSS
jgi:hypothetical protein